VAARGTPVPDGYLQSRRSLIPNIPKADVRRDRLIDSGDGKLVRVNSVKIINSDSGKKTVPRGCNFAIGRVQCSQTGLQLWITVARDGLDLAERGQRRKVVHIVYRGEILVEVGKDQHRKIEMAAVHFELGVL